MKCLAALTAGAMVLASCSGGERPGAAGLATVHGRGSISSSAFADGGRMPARFTCDGPDVSPPVRWRAPASATAGPEFLLLVVDVDAPGGGFVHWLAYHLPAAGSILEGGPVPGVEGTNTFHATGYEGPCPPRGDPPHRYRFRLYAMAPSATPVPAGESVDDLLGGIPTEAPIAEWTGTYSRA